MSLETPSMPLQKYFHGFSGRCGTVFNVCNFIHQAFIRKKPAYLQSLYTPIRKHFLLSLVVFVPIFCVPKYCVPILNYNIATRTFCGAKQQLGVLDQTTTQLFRH